MDKKKKTKLRKYILYSLTMAIVFGFVSSIIDRYIPNNNEIFNWQTFMYWIFTATFVLLLFTFFPRFKKSGVV